MAGAPTRGESPAVTASTEARNEGIIKLLLMSVFIIGVIYYRDHQIGLLTQALNQTTNQARQARLTLAEKEKEANQRSELEGAATDAMGEVIKTNGNELIFSMAAGSFV